MSAGVLPPLTGAAFGGKPDDFQVHTIKPDVRFLIKGVQPPSQVYVTTDDDLVVGCATSQAGEAVTVSYRLLRPDGQIVLGQGVIRPASDRSITVHRESLCEGFLLSVSCKAAVATTRGQTFVRIFLTNPSLGGGQPSYMLMADYVTTAMAPAFPNGRQLAPSEGPGNIRVAQGTLVPGGAQWFCSVPINARWKLISSRSNFSCGPTVGPRSFDAQIFSGGDLVWDVGATNTVDAGASGMLMMGGIYFPLLPSISGSICVPVSPNMILLANAQFNVFFTQVDLADDFSNAIVYVEEWLDNV